MADFFRHQNATEIILEVICGAAFLTLPTIIALARRNKDVILIASVNIIFIYAFEVWVPLMIWAFSGNRNEGLIDRIQGSRRNIIFSIAVLVAVTAGAAWGTYSLFLHFRGAH
jgi:hypothetical protein